MSLNSDRPATVVTFGNDWKDRNHCQLDDSLVKLDTHPLYDQRRQQDGEGNMEGAWSTMEGEKTQTSAHPKVPLREG